MTSSRPTRDGAIEAVKDAARRQWAPRSGRIRVATWEAAAVVDAAFDTLRAQVEALPERADAHDEDCPGRPGRRGICNCEGDILISRRAALALLGGEQP